MSRTYYHPSVEPPNLWDRFLSRPWASVFAFFSLWGGPRFVYDAVTPETISGSIGHAPPYAELLIGVVLTLGGLLVSWAVVAPNRIMTKLSRMTTERLGQIAQSCGYLSYGIALGFFPGVYGGAAASVTIGVGVAAAIRVLALALTERRALKILDETEPTKG